jgi:iron(III) transport system ATP-binding protein
MKSITVESLRLRRHQGFVLGPLSLHLEAGSRTALVGPSGCGKTTLLRCIAGLQEHDAGLVRIGEQIVSDGRPRIAPSERRIGFVFQDGALWPHMNAIQHLRFAAPSLSKTQAVELLDRVELGDKGKRKPGALSGGEAQRLALARALVGDPEILLLDEPLHSVDAMLRDRLGELIRDVAQDRGLTLVMVTHDRREAGIVADQVLVMEGGRLQSASDDVDEEASA